MRFISARVLSVCSGNRLQSASTMPSTSNHHLSSGPLPDRRSLAAVLFFSALYLAQRALVAAIIRARPSALIPRFFLGAGASFPGVKTFFRSAHRAC